MTAALIVAGCALLAARPALLHMGPPVLVVVVLFSALLLGATVVRQPVAERGPRTNVAVVLLVGLGAFALGRVITGGVAPAAWSLRFLALNSLAAVAEEAFFRRVVYAALIPAGAAYAIGGSALLFALVHLPIYGAWVLPLDLAAGVLFGWQRWASKSWRIPAVTHIAANVLVIV